MRKHTRGPRKSALKLPSELATPVRIRWHTESLLETKEEAYAANAAALKAANTKVRNKLPLLFDVLDLSRTGNDAVDYMALSLNLAIEFIPGFRIDLDGKPRGRPKDLLNLAWLMVDAEFVKRKKQRARLSHSDRQIVDILTSKLPYSRRWGSYSKGTLQNLLKASRDIKRNPCRWFLEQEYDLNRLRDFLPPLPGVTKNRT